MLAAVDNVDVNKILAKATKIQSLNTKTHDCVAQLQL